MEPDKVAHYELPHLDLAGPRSVVGKAPDSYR